MIGNKIVNIKGSWHYCEIEFDNCTLRCSGELMQNGFCIYESKLELSKEEIMKLKQMLKESNPDGTKVSVYIE